MATDGKVLYVGEEPDGLLDPLALDNRIELNAVPTAAAAQSRLEDGRQDIDCLVCRQTLPDSSGVEFLSWVRDRLPATTLPFVLVAADGSERLAERAVNEGATGYHRLAPPDAASRLTSVVLEEVDRACGDGHPSLSQYRTLKRDYDRLETFRSVISHDLRTPLNVAEGHLEMLDAGTPAEESLERVQEAVEQVETLVDELRTLARQGQLVEKPEPVTLETAATTAWERIPTDGAALDVRATGAVLADADRIEQLFRNLFRNALDHGEATTITVGDLQDGFYIRDDGRGVSEAYRDDIFDPGVSTTDAPGFGLAVAEQISAAHGWDIELVSADDGARFEVTSVARPE